MRENLHKLRLFLAKHRLIVSSILAGFIFLFLLVNFQAATQSRRGGIFLFLQDFGGVYPATLLMSAFWFGILFFWLGYEDSQWVENQITKKQMAKNEIYAQAAKELVDKDQIKMDVWGKALMESQGDEQLAKAKYIELRVKEGIDEAR